MNKLNEKTNELWVVHFLNAGGTQGRFETINIDFLPSLIKDIKKADGTVLTITNEKQKSFK